MIRYLFCTGYWYRQVVAARGAVSDLEGEYVIIIVISRMKKYFYFYTYFNSGLKLLRVCFCQLYRWNVEVFVASDLG